MRTFGSYEAVEELSRTAFGAVYSARPVGSKDRPSHFVKVFAPPAIAHGAGQPDSQTENFLAAARLQQKAAQASRHWAAIHDIGASPEGAYYVSSLYPMSARRLVMGKVKLTDADLHALISAIVQGLRDLRTSCAQAHGNIKLTTVLLPRGGEAAYAQAVLAEPLLPHKAAAVTEAADLADLARLIYHVVFHRPLSDAGGWPIAAGPEWSRLGPRGDSWRELCNALLNPNPDPSLSLDSLARTLANDLKPRRPLVSARLRVAAAALVVLMGIGYGLYAHYAPSFRYRTEDWIQLADAYSGWLRVLDTYESYPQLNAAVQRNAELMSILRELKDSDIVFDTKEILETREYGYDQMREHFPTTADGRRLTRVAVEFMPIVQERLKQWQALRLAAQVSQRCEPLAPAVARELSRMLASASTESSGSPDPDAFANALAELASLAPSLDAIDKDLTAVDELEKSLLAQRIAADRPVFPDLPKLIAAAYHTPARAASTTEFATRVGEVKGALDSISRAWTALDPRMKAIYDADDAVLSLLPDFVEDALHDDTSAPQSPALAALARRVQDLAAQFAQSPWTDLHARAVQWKGGNIDRIEFVKDEPYTSLRTDDPRGQLIAWAARAKMYVKLPESDDPRTALAARVKQLEEALNRLDADYPDPANVPEDNARLKQRAEAWQIALAELQTPKWLAGWKDQITRGAGSAGADLDALLAAIEQARVVLPEVRDAFIARVRGRGAQFGHSLLRQQWQTLAGLWLKDEATWKRDERALRPPAFRDLQEKVSRAEARMAAIESALPNALEINPGPRPAAWTNPLIAELQTLAAIEHQKAVAAAIAQSDWSNLAADGFSDRFAVSRDAYLVWRTEAGRLVDDLNLIESLLDGGYGFQPVVKEAYDRATKSNQWQAAAKLLQPLADRISRLGSLENARADLLAAAKGDDASLAVAAWRRLGALDWPNDLAELDEELAIQKRLDERLSAPPQAARSPAAEKHLEPFRAALADERRSRRQTAWRRLAEEVDHGAAARQQLDALMAKMPACDVTFPPDAQLPLKPATLFNIALHRLRTDVRTYKPGEEDALATDRLRQFRAELPDTLKRQQAVIDLLSELEKAAQPTTGQQVVLAEDGPPASPVKSMRWALQRSENDDVRTYKWGAHTLVFRRLEQRPGAAAATGEPVFLCTTEVPLGLFVDVIEAAAAEQKAPNRASFAGLNYDQYARGPHVWRILAGRVRSQSRWLVVVEALFETREYAPRFREVDKHLEGIDGLRMPMQRIPPASAMHLAALLGCRLPTSAEFEAARLAQGAAAPPNLRDPAWKEQFDHIAKIVADEGGAAAAQAPWPDTGTFETTSAPPFGADAQAFDNAADDNFLWFRPVAPGDKYSDLIGNVAEYLWDDIALLEDAPKVKTLATFRGIIAKHAKGNLYVAGGSAISAPQLGFGRHEVVNHHSGFADVGFRLAFTVPSRTIVDRIRIMADKQQYMLAAKAP